MKKVVETVLPSPSTAVRECLPGAGCRKFCGNPASVSDKCRQDAKDSRIGVAVCQFDREKPFTAVQLFGQLDMGVHRRVDELHGLERIFSTAGFERWQWFVFGWCCL